MVARSIPQRRRRPGDEWKRDAVGFARVVASGPREDDATRTNPVAQQRSAPSSRRQPRLDILTEPPELAGDLKGALEKLAGEIMVDLTLGDE